MVASAQRIPAPRPPEPRQPYRFPVLATVAPMLVAVVIWAVTNSPFALVFAALGPVTALASVVDAKVGSRRTAKREGRRFAAELEATRALIAQRHAAERAALCEAVPSAESIAGRRGADPYRWTAAATSPLPVSLGIGRVPSALELERPPRGSDPAVEEQLDRLESRVAALSDAPVVVDARLGLGVCGPRTLAVAFARAILLQLAWALPPSTVRCGWSVPMSEAEWLRALPHPTGERPARPGHVVEFTHGDAPPVMVAVAAAESELPPGCRAVVRLGGGGSATLVEHPDREQRRAFRPSFLSRERAIAWSIEAAQDAAAHGLIGDGSRVPAAVQLAPLLRADPSPAGSLACEPAVGGDGPVTLDLVNHGPHAVVGGTTGSGKSELLVSWILAMAAPAPPTDVSFLLVDFKGGSAFGALAALPHTVGTITDLDEEQAARALASLKAELRYRERRVADSGARGIEGVPGLGRLVIVVDEFAAMMTDHPDLHSLFADLAARGRSLGVHLVLCTQRPAGVVRDAVLANADLRISLRVNNRADSSAVVGTDAAAEIPPTARGRGILSLAGGSPVPVQFALATEADTRLIATRWRGQPSPRRPWCDPLPPVVDPAELPAGAFGLLDLPEEQRRAPALWNPASDGHLLVLGAPGSGISTTLAALAAPVPVAHRVASGVDAAWDAVADLVELMSGISADPLLAIVDDLDSLLGRFPAEHRAVLVERLALLLRDGPARGIHFALGAQRITAELQALATLVPSRLLLRHASRQDFVLAGGEGARYLDRLPPGGGLWRGHRVQVALAGHDPTPEPAARVAELAPGRAIAIVTTRAAAMLGRPGVVDLARGGADPRELVVSSGGAPVILVGDVEEWQSRWGALSALRPVADILFDGCSLADVRALTRSRTLPPPITGAPGLCWRLAPDGTLDRVRLPL